MANFKLLRQFDFTNKLLDYPKIITSTFHTKGSRRAVAPRGLLERTLFRLLERDRDIYI